MTYELYKILHVVGLVVVFLGLGGIFSGGGKTSSMLNGIGLVVLIVSGFGMQAKGQLEFKGWLISMIGIWVVFAVLPLMVKRKVLPSSLVNLIAITLAGIAAWLAIAKPF